MSTFDNPFDPSFSLNNSGCSCGRHISQVEHERDTAQLQCLPAESEQKRYENVVASAVMRALFPKDVSRRAFLHSLGASTALAALSQFFPLKTATDVFASGGHPLYYATRNHIIDFLVSRSRSFIEETRGAYDPRHVSVVRPGLPEPMIATTQDSSKMPNRGQQAAAH